MSINREPVTVTGSAALTVMLHPRVTLHAIESASQHASARGIHFAADTRGMLATIGPGPDLAAFVAALWRSRIIGGIAES